MYSFIAPSKFQTALIAVLASSVLSACNAPGGTSPAPAPERAAGTRAAAASQASSSTLSKLNVAASYAGGVITLTNTSGNTQNLSDVEVTFTDPDSISGFWGSPWMNWQFQTSGTTYTLTGGTPYSTWPNGGSVTIDFTVPYMSHNVPSSIVAYQLVPPAPTPIAVSTSTTSGNLTITNTTGSPIAMRSMEIDFTYAGTIASVWGSPWIAWTITRSGNSYVLTGGTSDSTQLQPGQTLTVSFTPTSGASMSAIVFKAVANGSASSGAPPASTPTPKMTPTPTPTPTPTATPTSTPTPPAAPNAAASIYRFAPYADMTNWPVFDINAASLATGTRAYTMAFVVSYQNTCQGAWGALVLPQNTGKGGAYGGAYDYLDMIASIRARGEDVIGSFGGEANTELADVCSNATALEAAYQSIVDYYNFTHIDFDIEGADDGNTTSIALRSTAIAMLQKHYTALGKTLSVSYTLPVLPSGLTQDGLNVVKAAVNAGVKLDIINIMAMDYGWAADANTPIVMGSLAIQAVQSTESQLKSIYPGMSDAQLYGMLGVTPLIGVNDDSLEVFGLADAQQLLAWAQQVQLGRIAFWSAAKDQPCPGYAQLADANTCSGLPQSANESVNEFQQIFSAY